MTAVLFLLKDWAETFSCHSESINEKYWKRSGFHVIILQEMTDMSGFGVQKSELWLRSSFTGSPATVQYICQCFSFLTWMASFLLLSLVPFFLFLCIYFPFSSLRPRTQLFPTECSAEGWAFVSCCRETWRRRRRQAHFLAANSGSMSVWEKAGETDMMMAE